MIARLIAACAHHRWLTILVTALMLGWGIWSARNAPLDAVPDLSDVQVIVYTEWMGRGPDLVEDQITTPISSALLSTPNVRAVRGQSMFGMSFVYVVFEDGTDLYQARSRVLEYLDAVRARLPTGVSPTLGPDATGVGWIYQYALEDPTGAHDVRELRTLQDWTLRYALESIPGVAEVASVGGFQKELQVDVDPERLLAAGVTLDQVMGAVGGANATVGGRVMEIAGHEQVVRGRGWVTDPTDIAVAPLFGDPLRASPLPGSSTPAIPTPTSDGMGMGSSMSPSPSASASAVAPSGSPGTLLSVANVAEVQLGAAQRRGVTDLDGKIGRAHV